MKKMINFSVGPVQMNKEIRKLGKNQIPYFRTKEFSEITKENEKILCELADAPENSRVVFLTGSGTASMEACVMNLFTKDDKVLVVNGGSFGSRFVELCKVHKLNYEEIKLNYGEPLRKAKLDNYVNKGFTGMLVQLCETSTGIKYDINMIGNFCKENSIFLCVDAISGFLADEISMKENHVGAMITGSQKALALPPAMSFIILNTEAQNKVNNAKVESIYFNLSDYLKNGERGQTPFTPAVSVILQLNARLKKIKLNGGIKDENSIIKERAKYFRENISNLPLEIFVTGTDASNCVTSIKPKNTSAYKIFDTLKDEYGIWICPNGGELKDLIFRVGHIGDISKKEIDKLIGSLKDMAKRGLL